MVLVRSVEDANVKIVGLLRIKSEYVSRTNIRNRFAPAWMPEGTTFSMTGRSLLSMFVPQTAPSSSPSSIRMKKGPFFILFPCTMGNSIYFILSLTFHLPAGLPESSLGGRVLGFILVLPCIISCHPCCPETAVFFQTLFPSNTNRMNDFFDATGIFWH